MDAFPAAAEAGVGADREERVRQMGFRPEHLTVREQSELLELRSAFAAAGGAGGDPADPD